MTNYDTPIHHRRSIRLKSYDYTQPGAYFVTICSHERCCLFGNIRDGVMILNQYGEIVQSCWREIQQHFPHIQLSAFVVMPNHLHGIIIISERARHVGTRHAVSLRESLGKPVRGSLPTIVRSFKSASTKRLNALAGALVSQVWQKRYYERIIRTDKELSQAIEYINNNPLQWEMDQENPAVI